MLGLGWWWVFSWMHIDTVRGWERVVESCWTEGGVGLAWWQHGDVPFHVGTSFLLVLVLEFGRTLLRPTWPSPAVLAAAVAIAFFDETLQCFSPARTFDWRDLGSDDIGMAIAVIVILVVRYTDGRMRMIYAH